MLSDTIVKRCNTVEKPAVVKMLHVRTSLKAGVNSGICWETINGKCITNCCPTDNGPSCYTSCYNPSLD